MIPDGILQEGHLEAILSVFPTSGISSWLTPDQITLELAREIKCMSWDGFLTEGHLREVSGIVGTSQLSAWLTPDQITLELDHQIKHM